MPEYIEREAMLKIIHDIKENKEIPKNYGTLLDIIRLIRNHPTADVAEVKYGEWEREFDDMGIDRGYKCSACRNSVYQMTYEPFAFCPHCGAKMGHDIKEKR